MDIEVGDASPIPSQMLLLQIPDVSFSMPQRKKLRLEVQGDGALPLVQGRSSATGELEFQTETGMLR